VSKTCGSWSIERWSKGRARVVLLALVLVCACSSSSPGPRIYVRPDYLSPEARALAYSLTVDGIGADATALRGWRVYVEPYPLHFDPPLATSDFGTVTSATSVTYLQQRVIVLTWRILPGGGLVVRDIPWEVSNALRGGPAPGTPGPAPTAAGGPR